MFQRSVKKAISQAIDIEKIKQETNIDDLDKLAERIKKEKNEYGAIFKNEGFKDGVHDAYNMAYDELIFFQIYIGTVDYSEVLKTLASVETVDKYESLLVDDFEFIDSTTVSKEESNKTHSNGKVTVDLKGIDISTSFGPSFEDFMSFSDFEDFYLEGWIEGVNHIISLLHDKGVL
ncbi:MAG: hypothetical protein OMM_06129 [Candidatus Magnetoglobus multicellularis str. Araruama]|uniref:Uncharacterized protein n=1 Tax=Candidatus Magnetoglobus multicellularis str. Araruama TaxID=890399 RepID=A0A1V1NRC3_9BACT|nr:MAG: hypothetical protein OMM_06129 [Candidatus Magnetoglobus multicellularis str. Araruama]